MMPICQRRGEEKVHLAGCRFRAMTLSALHLVVNWPVFGRPFVKRFALCYQSVVCPVCLSCLWRSCTVAKRLDGSRWNLDADRPRPWPHCVRWGPSSPLPMGHSPLPIFGPYLLRPNGWMDQDGTWHGGRPQPSGLCVRWGPSPLNFRFMFIIVIVISLEHCTGVIRYWFVQVQVQV